MTERTIFLTFVFMTVRVYHRFALLRYGSISSLKPNGSPFPPALLCLFLGISLLGSGVRRQHYLVA